MGRQLERLNVLGVKVGVATGRGPSAGVALRDGIDETCWANIIVGYYNGSVVTTLADDNDPLVNETGPASLLEALGRHPHLGDVEVKANAVQVTLRPKSFRPLREVIDAVQDIVKQSGMDICIAASSHSIDLIFGGGNKESVVRKICDAGVLSENCLRIGDRGRMPGNDALLLDHPLGLSVDQISASKHHCWNLAPAGIAGVDATEFYLRCLKETREGVRFSWKASARGVIDEA
jgi:hydroxymethylpyrimidine pyrophosphatase-like HAD family hydrolase